MRLDPTRWLVSSAGFVYDWIITRHWSQVFFGLLPVIFFGITATAAWWGSSLDRTQLAQWYLELGEEEIEEWEQSWAPETADAESDTAGAEDADSGDGQAAESDGEGAGSESKNAAIPGFANSTEVSRFAEVLFRRVQMLEPRDRSEFVIAAVMAQRGALGQARSLLTKIAPADRPGYAPAHAFLAQFMFMQGNITQEGLKALTHHIEQATRWEKVPIALMLDGAKLFAQVGRRSEAIGLLRRAADMDPKYNLELAKVASALNNRRLAEQARPKAISYYSRKLRENPGDETATLKLTEALADAGELEKAEQLMIQAMRQEPTEKLRRGLSEVYRLRFLRSIRANGSSATANIAMLDLALRTDPTNPLVYEQLARMTRMPGVVASSGLIEKLEKFLAEGKATATTHAWLAEAYLVQQKFRRALPHLEQVVTRLPKAAESLNNLAYVLAELEPDRLEEALEYSQRAVKVSTKDPNPDFYDTLGMVLGKLGKTREAIAAMETAVELQKGRVDFHQRLAKLYREDGNERMAENHEQIIEAIQLAEQEEAAQQDAEQALRAGSQPSSQPAASDADPSASEQNDTSDDGAKKDSNKGEQ